MKYFPSFAAAVVLLAAGSTHALATPGAVYYADGDALRDGEGTQGNPFNSLASLEGALNADPNNSTAYVTGTFRGQSLRLDHMNGVLLTIWPGRTRPQIRGDTVIASWTEEVAGTRYSANIGTARNVVSVVEDWDTNLTADGRNYGHLIRQTTTGDIEASRGSWYYDAVTGLLHIHTSSDDDPNTNGKTYGWCRGGHGINLNSPRSTTIDGFDVKLFCDYVDPNGVAIRFADAIGCTIRNCNAWDVGNHALGFVSTNCRDNLLENCVARGCTDQGALLFVMAAHNGPMVTGCTIRDCDAHVYRTLDWNQQPRVESGGPIGGFNTHALFPSQVLEMKFVRCAISAIPASRRRRSSSTVRQTVPRQNRPIPTIPPLTLSRLSIA